MEPLRADPTMARLIDDHGPLELEPASDPFRRLIVSIVNQQLSTASATTIRGRLFERFEITPAGILAADEAALRDVGLSTQKIEYLKTTAQAFDDGTITPSALEAAPNEDVIAALTAIHGIGEWTAQMYLIFVLARPDVLPLGDLAVRRAIENLYNDGESMRREEMRAVADDWRPARSLATLYLWAEYEAA